ncbi:hypothetical protein QE374_001260 [Microbacterium sp. SORGH_AS428]|uniref:hypothetical protein n=1 Tax=Microbacterium sp. SORGH_AS_0428 TaxID=3041788 RepID=UPI002859F99D|nr:hypothetical protein [Microbacterium sp. SORGH_AS_0428]MDR6199351.1 hypothetical protein [Microbacterium sp. SORGH_AS_0428]
MQAPYSRSEYRSSAGPRETAVRDREAKARARRRRRLHRKLSQRPHWSLYIGVALLAGGVIALVAAAMLTR